MFGYVEADALVLGAHAQRVDAIDAPEDEVDHAEGPREADPHAEQLHTKLGAAAESRVEDLGVPEQRHGQGAPHAGGGVHGYGAHHVINA